MYIIRCMKIEKIKINLVIKNKIFILNLTFTYLLK